MSKFNLIVACATSATLTSGGPLMAWQVFLLIGWVAISGISYGIELGRRVEAGR